MNSTIKRVVVSVALLQTICSQSFAEQEAPKGYMEMACDLWSRRPSMPSMPSISMPKISMPTISMPKVSLPHFSMPSMPESVVAKYNEYVAPQITLQNGKYAAAGVAVLAGLYVGYKAITKNKSVVPVEINSVVPAEMSLKEQILDAMLEGRIAEAKKLVANSAVLMPEEKNNAIILINRYFNFIALSKQDSHNQDQSNLATKAFDLLDKVLDKCA